MDHSTPPDASAEETFLVDVSTLARRYARLFMLRDDANDLAQDLVLECLTTLRAGARPFEVAEHVGLVKTMVHRRLLNSLRRDDRRASRDAEHERDRADSTHVWMQPDLGIEERELEEFREKTLASLPRMCRRVYTMVREEEMSYQAVANTLGISRSAVHAHVATAQQRFRIALRVQGVAVPSTPTTCRRARRDGPALVLHRPQQLAQACERRNDAAA